MSRGLNRIRDARHLTGFRDGREAMKVPVRQVARGYGCST